jgi:hypothetical protein
MVTNMYKGKDVSRKREEEDDACESAISDG